MGYQVFPAASGAADYENVGVHVEGNTAPVADAVLFSPIRSRFTISSALTAGIYLAETDEITTVTANVIINNSTFRVLNPSMGTANTSGVTLITVSTNQSSFQTEAQMGWNQEASGPFSGSTARISFTYAPGEGDTRPFVVAGGIESSGQNQITWSTDGVSWTEARPDTAGNASQVGTGRVAWSDGTNLWWNGNVNNSLIWWSTNGGVNWTTRGSHPISALQNGYYDTVFARHYIWTGNNAESYYPYTSTNGINWSSTNRIFSGNPGFIKRIGNRLYIGNEQVGGEVGGTSGNNQALAFTTDGTNWNSVTTFPTSTGGIYGMTYSTAVGRYVAAGARGGMFHSTDGLNWTTGDKNTNLGVNAFQPGWYSVNYGDGYFVAAGAHNAIASGVIISTDGMNWTDIGATSGVLTQGSTSHFLYQGSYNPDKAGKWLFYQFTRNGNAAGVIDNPTSREYFLKAPSPTPVWYHNNVVGRIKQGFNFILTRYKMGRNIR
jgi:hypothetical protein